MAETTAAPRPPRALVATALVAVGVVVAAFVLQLVSDDPPAPRVIAAHVAIGAVWLAAGLVAWARHPTFRTGPLMLATGVLWLLLALYTWRAGRAVRDLRDDDR